jgi:hypothetical protein
VELGDRGQKQKKKEKRKEQRVKIRGQEGRDQGKHRINLDNNGMIL